MSDGIGQDIQRKNKEIQSLQSELQKLKITNKQEQLMREQNSIKIQAKLQNKVQELNSKISQLSNMNSQLQQQLTKKTSRIKQLQDMLKSQQQQSKSQEKQISQQQQKNQVDQIKAKRQYLLQIFPNQKTVDERYSKSVIDIGFWKNNYNIEFSKEDWGLAHTGNKIQMQEFVKLNWSELKLIDLGRCAIDDNGWRIFVKNAHMYPNIKVIDISDNKIQTIMEGDLQQFQYLQYIFFGFGGRLNPLSKESKYYLRSVQKNNPKLIIKFI